MGPVENVRFEGNVDWYLESLVDREYNDDDIPLQLDLSLRPDHVGVDMLFIIVLLVLLSFLRLMLVVPEVFLPLDVQVHRLLDHSDFLLRDVTVLFDSEVVRVISLVSELELLQEQILLLQQFNLFISVHVSSCEFFLDVFNVLFSFILILIVLVSYICVKSAISCHHLRRGKGLVLLSN